MFEELEIILDDSVYPSIKTFTYELYPYDWRLGSDSFDFLMLLKVASEGMLSGLPLIYLLEKLSICSFSFFLLILSFSTSLIACLILKNSIIFLAYILAVMYYAMDISSLTVDPSIS
jgi:hypothetical protein